MVGFSLRCLPRHRGSPESGRGDTDMRIVQSWWKYRGGDDPRRAVTLPSTDKGASADVALGTTILDSADHRLAELSDSDYRCAICGGNCCLVTPTTTPSIWIFDKSAFPALAAWSITASSISSFSMPSENVLPGC